MTLLNAVLWLYGWGGEISCHSFCLAWTPPWQKTPWHKKKKNLLTPTNFHTVDSRVLKGCDLECCINTPLFSLPARAVLSPRPLIWHLVFRLAVNRIFVCIAGPSKACVQDVDGSLVGICVWADERGRHSVQMDEEREGRRVLAFINIPPRIPHFLGAGLSGSEASELFYFAPEAFTCFFFVFFFQRAAV